MHAAPSTALHPCWAACVGMREGEAQGRDGGERSNSPQPDDHRPPPKKPPRRAARRSRWARTRRRPLHLRLRPLPLPPRSPPRSQPRSQGEAHVRGGRGDRRCKCRRMRRRCDKRPSRQLRPRTGARDSEPDRRGRSFGWRCLTAPRSRHEDLAVRRLGRRPTALSAAPPRPCLGRPVMHVLVEEQPAERGAVRGRRRTADDSGYVLDPRGWQPAVRK